MGFFLDAFLGVLIHKFRSWCQLQVVVLGDEAAGTALKM